MRQPRHRRKHERDLTRSKEGRKSRPCGWEHSYEMGKKRHWDSYCNKIGAPAGLPSIEKRSNC